MQSSMLFCDCQNETILYPAMVFVTHVGIDDVQSKNKSIIVFRCNKLKWNKDGSSAMKSNMNFPDDG